MKYRPDIDGLRAVAVLPVVFYHTGFSWFRGGFVGVDVFFVISGYLITHILLDEIREDRFSLAGFYERRVRRIFPALFTVMFCTSLAAGRIMLPRAFEEFGQSMVAATLFVANIFFWTESGYFAPAAESRPLLHTWSLSVEEQFYLLFPLVLVFIFRRFQGRWQTLLLPAALVSLLLNLWATRFFPNAAFFLTPMRGWELLLGAFLALGAFPGLNNRPAREICAAAGLGLILWAVVRFTAQDPFPGWRALLPCLGAALFIHAGTRGKTLAGRLLSCRLPVFIGLISYSLYLWHWPLHVFSVAIHGSDFSRGRSLAVVGLSILLAVLSWRFVEQPFRKKGAVLERRKLLQAAGVLMAVFVLTGYIFKWTDGLPSRFGGSLVRLDCDLATYNLSTCFLKEDQPWTDWAGERCLVTSGHERTLLLWGDSFAAHYVPGIASLAPKLPFNVLQYTAGGCAPAFGYDPAYRPRCREFADQVTGLITRYRVDTVILAAAWKMALDNGLKYEQVARTVSRLRSLGCRVVIVGQSPRFARSVQDIYNRAQILGHPRDRAEVAVDLEEINHRLAAIVGPENFVDPSRIFCSGSRCRFRDQEGFYFWDDGHMTRKGSSLAAGYIFSRLGL